MATTVKQRNFARLVATGMPKTEAYDQAYGDNGGKKRTRRITASKESLKPEVQAEIAKFEERMAPIEDLRAVRREMLQNIRWLAIQARDERVRFAASTHLQQYADEREKLEEARRLRQGALTIDGLIHEIRQLDAPEATVEMETVEEPQEAAGEAAQDAAQGGEKPE